MKFFAIGLSVTALAALALAALVFFWPVAVVAAIISVGAAGVISAVTMPGAIAIASVALGAVAGLFAKGIGSLFARKSIDMSSFHRSTSTINDSAQEAEADKSPSVEGGTRLSSASVPSVTDVSLSGSQFGDLNPSEHSEANDGEKSGSSANSEGFQSAHSSDCEGSATRPARSPSVGSGNGIFSSAQSSAQSSARSSVDTSLDNTENNDASTRSGRSTSFS